MKKSPVSPAVMNQLSGFPNIEFGQEESRATDQPVSGRLVACVAWKTSRLWLRPRCRPGALPGLGGLMFSVPKGPRKKILKRASRKIAIVEPPQRGIAQKPPPASKSRPPNRLAIPLFEALRQKRISWPRNMGAADHIFESILGSSSARDMNTGRLRTGTPVGAQGATERRGAAKLEKTVAKRFWQ